MAGLFGGGGGKKQAAAPVAAAAPKAALPVEEPVDRGGTPIAAGGSTDLIRRLGFTGTMAQGGGRSGGSMLGR